MYEMHTSDTGFVSEHKTTYNSKIRKQKKIFNGQRKDFDFQNGKVRTSENLFLHKNNESISKDCKKSTFRTLKINQKFATI